MLPLDGEVGIEGLAGWEIAEAFFDANIQKINECSAVIANMTPFRGPGMDGGTAFEIGYAHSAGKSIVGWSSDDRDYIDRVRVYFGSQIAGEIHRVWKSRTLDNLTT